MPNPATILIADPHDVTRANIASLLKSHGFKVLQAIDGASAIKVVQEHPVDLAVFEPDMSPMTGFDFARYVVGAEMKLPLVVMMTERTSDVLNYATQLGITHFLSKPIDPRRLEAVVQRLLKQNATPAPHASFAAEDDVYTPDEIMAKTIELARQNVRSGHGGPFAAIVIDAHGHILGQGTNLSSSWYDPLALAEVMAIRQATEHLNSPHLEGCSIFCCAEPTTIGQALILSVGIENVYYGVSHEDIDDLRARHEYSVADELAKPAAKRRVNTIRLGYDTARLLFESSSKPPA